MGFLVILILIGATITTICISSYVVIKKDMNEDIQKKGE